MLEIKQYQQSLNQAKKFDEEGVSINEIEKQTGWFKNKQGQWKYFSNEILNEFLDIPQIKNKIVDLIEKPSVEEAPSNYAGMGRYIVSSNIFDILDNIKTGKNDEYQFVFLHQFCYW